MKKVLLPARRIAALALICVPLAAQTMPPLKRQPTPAKVVEEHMAAQVTTWNPAALKWKVPPTK